MGTQFQGVILPMPVLLWVENTPRRLPGDMRGLTALQQGSGLGWESTGAQSASIRGRQSILGCDVLPISVMEWQKDSCLEKQ